MFVDGFSNGQRCWNAVDEENWLERFSRLAPLALKARARALKNALRFRSAVKLALSILSGDQGVKIQASKMAARNITKAMEETEAKNGNDNFLTAMPEASPKAEPKRSSLTASAGIDDIFFVFLKTWLRLLLLCLRCFF